MFRSKKDVDRHVKDIFIKLKTSEEKTLRCYNIAKLYYQVGDYESAKKYVSNYLEIRGKCAGAHKLLGQALEALRQKEAAFMQYKISLEIEPKQDDLILKVCELLTDMDVKMDVNIIKYWVERADKKFPHHPIVFELKEKMLTQEKSDGSNDDLEKLITSELMVRQTDVHLQVKLLKHYIANHRLEDAYNHAAGIEAKHSHRNSIDWYQSLSELLVECKPSKQLDWTFWIFYISVLERYAALCLKEQGNVEKNIADAMEAVFNFDQSLTEFKSRSISVHQDFIKNVLLHMWGQLHFHLACLFLRKTKRREESWFEAGRLCAPLLLNALHVTPIDPTALWTTHLKNRLVKNLVHVWHREGSYRCSQAGHVLRDYARDNKKKLLDKIDKFCTNSWREHGYQKIFGKPYENRKATSYFSNEQVANPPLRLCSYNELKRFDEISEEVWPNSLHHQIWLGLRTRHRSSHNKNDGPRPNQTSRVFSELQFSVFNLNQAAPDSLSRLDIDAFLNAAIFCASAVIEEQLSDFLDPDKFPTLPADLTNTLCTCSQEKWWSSAYKVYSMDKQKPLDEDLGEIRLELQRGLEVVRCIGNHGLHPILLVHLARIFHYRAEALKETDQENGDISSLEARYEMYWLNAIPLLERLQNNQILRVTNTKFFNYQGPEMNNADLIKALEEGKLLQAQRFLRDKQHEKAIDALQALKCPEASFQQGKVYEMLADEIVSYMPKESLTSEIRSQHIVMLSKARECFYLTLDRLRSPGTNPKHPLNSELSTHMSNIENKLKKIDPDLSRGNLNRNECSDGTSEESYSSAHSVKDLDMLFPSFTGINSSFSMVSTPQRTAHRKSKQYSTPYRAQHQDVVDLLKNRSEARPSPERLDAQIRAINQTINVKDNMILEQNKNILEKMEELAKEVKELSKEVGELRKDMQRQRTQTDNVNPSLEEDLCVLSEEDYNDLHYNPNRLEPASSLPGNMFPTSHRHPYSQLVYPSTTAFQGYYPDGVFANPNAQPYSLYPPNVYPLPVLYPNARSKITENMLQQSLFTTRLPTQMPDLMPQTNQPLQVLLQKTETPKVETTIKDAPVNKVPPVNVVITTSDTLPTTVPVVQPTLSVTIPPHFRQGSISTSAVIEQPPLPHSYQIPMPSQATIPTTVNLPPLASTLTTTPANISVTETPMMDNTNVRSTGSPNSSDHEHDPIPDFVPVIPLPAEVKVTTGEEGQETLFCARGKLFRFVDNEWKERGIGNVKLLRNEEGKIRLLMRREQVLKVCANHYLAPDMELTAKSNDERTWLWVAHDFADGELKVEKFCIRFKTAEEGTSFKEHFEKAKASLAQLSDKSADGAGKASIKPNSPANSVQKKEVKFVEQTSQKQPTEVTTISEASSEKSKANSASTVVGGFSFTSTPIIQKVATPEPSATPSKPDNSPFAGFMFIKTMTTAESSTTTTLKNSQTSTFAFANTTTPQADATSESVPTSVSQSSLRRPHAPPVCATAVVGIDDTSATTEHEEVLFEDKISLQYYVKDKQWDNRGTGQMKVLWNSKTGRIRLLMTEENSSKVYYNFNVSAKMPFTFKSGSTVVSWTIQYGLDNKTGMFAATFKTSTQASQFHNTLTNNQQKMVKDCVSVESLKKQEKTKTVQKSKTQVSLSEMFKPPSGSWECNVCYTRNDASNARCIACEMPNPSAPSKGSTPAATTSNQTPLSEMFKAPADSWKCKCCEIVNSSGNNYCVACDTPKYPSIPPKPKTDGFLIGTSTSGTTPTFTFGIPQDATRTGKAGFTFQKPADTSTDSKSDTKADTSKFTFVMPQRSGTPPNKGTPFTFDSPGKSFGFYFRGVSPTKSPGGGENSEEEVVESDDIHFSPVIPLPDKIEVKTGEEDEEILYLHRAKLFRFDKETGEWKERGLGDIKLLRHNQTGKLRLIMRREQILKLCLNHFILPGLDMTPKDEKTWMWNAADFSDGEIEHTLFACRFKTSDIAKNFKNVIDEARSAKNLPAGETKTEAKTEELAKAKPAQDIEVLYEMKVTTEEKDAATKLQLPENFYAYKQKPDCPGCRGCKEPTAPLFKDENSVTTASVQKTCTESRKPTIFSSKTESANATASNVPTTDTSAQNTASSTSKPGLQGTSIAQSTMNSFSTATPSTILFGNSDSKTSNDKKASFSFVMPQSQPSEQNILATENLRICSPIVSQGQAMSNTSSPFNASASSTTSAGSIFAMSDNPFNLSTGKSIFGGSSKKEAPGIIKPSSFNVSANSSESPFLNNFNSQLKTTTSATTMFGTSAPIFGSSAMKTSSETTSSDSSTFATNTTTTSLFGGSGKSTSSVFDNTSTPFTFNLAFGGRTNESPFGISNSTGTNTAETKTASSENESQKDSGISFLPSADVSFSALAAAAPQQAFKTDPNFSFSGAGSVVFGSKSPAVADKSAQKTKEGTQEKKAEHEEENAENENEQEHDPHFEPIVPLPDVIEVRTGEEDEEKVFCERAKLYRFDTATHEWKERGVGEMKVLHHAKQGTYRLLMRRDQVHKVVCNLLLTPDINFSRLSTSDRAWIWAGMNHAEEEPSVEELAVRFKNSELAEKFKDTINEIQHKLREIREQVTESNPIIEEPEEEENEEEENEDADEIEDEEDEDYSLRIFEKRATLFARTDADAKWKLVALGNLIIYYDSETFIGSIILKADETNEIVSNTAICTDIKMQVNKQECVWTAVDRALKTPTKRSLKAIFSSVQAAQEMYDLFQEVSVFRCK